MDYNVLNYGALSDGKTMCTQAVQKAVDECYANGGGVVRFDKGAYVLGTVFLKSNITIEISKDAELLGAENFCEYAREEKVDYPIYQDASHTYYHPSMFVGIDCENIKITGGGKIDMRSVWNEEKIGKSTANRGAKCIALKNCKNLEISNLEIVNATDLGVYFSGCENAEIFGLKMRVHIDGISPDNSKNVKIHDCDVESGDDGIVFKSSYTLGKIDCCDNISVWDCRVKSRCNAIKFGTESNGGFYNFSICNIDVYETRLAGIAIESIDGAIIDTVRIKNIRMQNVGTPLFIHLGSRLRGPEGREVGKIRNITLENITAKGPYEPYECITWNYASFMADDTMQTPWKPNIQGLKNFEDRYSEWQCTSNVCGLVGNALENITLKNVYFELDGGVKNFNFDVPEYEGGYPEVCIYGRILPAKGIYFRYVDGLSLDNVKIKTYRNDVRENFVFSNVNGLVIK